MGLYIHNRKHAIKVRMVKYLSIVRFPQDIIFNLYFLLSILRISPISILDTNILILYKVSENCIPEVGILSVNMFDLDFIKYCLPLKSSFRPVLS